MTTTVPTLPTLPTLPRATPVPRALDDVLRRLGTVDLAELTATAALQTRVDRKYVVPAAAAVRLVRELAASPDPARVLRVDGRHDVGYASVYFDTPDLVSFLLAARRRPRRFKVRTRTYVEQVSSWLEVKTRDRRGRTVKHRVPHDAARPDHLDAVAHAFVDGVLADERLDVAVRDLAPVLSTTYRRATVLLPDGGRLTVDSGLLCRTPDGAGVRSAEHTVVETKTAGHAGSADRLLWRAGHRPDRISKYATGLAALDPDLPATPWRAVLGRHVLTATD